ncbi:MAG: FAD-binding protein [Armatimonadota bacterium]|nr:FAD-binding protein [Armatimonadota bacterium]
MLGDVDRETQLHGLATVLGFVSNTGVAGLTLGGGFGYLTRRFGWTSDNVRAMDVVTAEGRVVRASESENADLFWASAAGAVTSGSSRDSTLRSTPSGPRSWGARSPGASRRRTMCSHSTRQSWRRLRPSSPSSPPSAWPRRRHGFARTFTDGPSWPCSRATRGRPTRRRRT